ncbi:hypothetical protein SASPL_118162 [Salvia splendens]|uniref:EamA domain-containing protein n=1 Tax=Salvia splendens TaxID=180675 RepID=A0A8X8XW86_SALSN|nr:uncharacterized protein LOC121806173 [Salvia splendens]KAG6421605.1 hypothetical protein SASPL_118162 [Salvia splendens]
MIYTCSWNSSYSAAAYCFDSCSHKKLTIFSSSSPSSNSSNYSLDSSTSRNILRSVVEKRTHVSIVVGCVSVKKKHFWNKLRFGSKKFRSIILLHLICFVYASNIAVIKEVEGFIDPAYFSAVRFVVSTVPFLPFVFKARKDAEVRSYGLELGLWVSLGYLSEALGLVTSDAGRASFISLFTVIVIPLLESMLGEMVPARTWFGILMSVVGISMLECSGSPPNIGDLFNFVSAIFFGIHTLRTEQISRTTRKENIFALLGYEVGVVAIMSTLWCLTGSSDDGLSLSWDWMFEFPWIPALYTGVFSTGLCLWGEIAALRDVSATETAVIYGLEPLWGAGFAWFLLGERWGVAGWIGAALILGGSLTVQILGSDGHVSKEKNKMKETMSASPVMVRSSSPDNAIHAYKKK